MNAFIKAVSFLKEMDTGVREALRDLAGNYVEPSKRVFLGKTLQILFYFSSAVSNICLC